MRNIEEIKKDLEPYLTKTGRGVRYGLEAALHWNSGTLQYYKARSPADYYSDVYNKRNLDTYHLLIVADVNYSRTPNEVFLIYQDEKKVLRWRHSKKMEYGWQIEGGKNIDPELKSKQEIIDLIAAQDPKMRSLPYYWERQILLVAELLEAEGILPTTQEKKKERKEAVAS